MNIAFLSVSLLMLSLVSNAQNTSPWPATGSVGIGTTTPGDLLHVNGIARANQLNLVNGTLNTTAAATNMSFNINGTNRMTLLAASGNLGIGTATPGDLLHVNGIARANQVNLVNGVLNTASGTTNMSFNINGTNRMTLLAASGNLGIGTATPGDLLHVNGIARANQLNLVNGILNTASGTTNMSFNINGTNRMTLLASNGYVGIGTATPSEALEIGGTGYLKVGGGRISLDGVAGYYGNGIRYESSQVRIFQSGSLGAAFGGGITTLYGGGNAALTIDGNRNVGIGTANPTQRLTVNGIIYGREVKVDAAVPGPDYVFEKDYDLLSLEDLRSYIESNKHLPEVPSAKEMEANGLNLSEMNLLLLKKVEELTLHLLAMDERMKALQKQLDDRGQK